MYLQFLGWDCDAECRYSCMWKTVHHFQLDGSDIPQFYGKVCFHIGHSLYHSFSMLAFTILCQMCVLSNYKIYSF